MEAMAKISGSDVGHIARLANIKLTSQETQKFSTQLSEVVSYIDKLKKVDTANTSPTSQTTGLENVYRKDAVMPEITLSQEGALSGSEITDNGYFEVPAILKED